MALWLVRSGAHGEEEQGALQHNLATIGWNEMPDVSKIDNKETLKEVYLKLHPNDKKMRAVRMVDKYGILQKKLRRGI